MLTESIKANGKIALQIVNEDLTSLPEEQRLFEIEAPGIEGYVLGRSDSGSSYQPDIDLALFEGQRRGISRRHAVLLRYRGTVQVMDLGSLNGTFVNGNQIEENVPNPLKQGDILGLADLMIVVSQ